MQLAPRAESSDGKVDVMLLRRTSRLHMLKLSKRIFDGSHLSLPFVEYRQVCSFGIELEGRDLLNLDAELKGATPVTADMIPAALRIFA